MKTVTKPTAASATKPASKPAMAKGKSNQTPAAASVGKSVNDTRWPDTVMARGYTKIPSILLWGQGRLKLEPDELNVLLQIISHWWVKGQNPHPSKASIARRMGKDPRTVQRHLTSLEDKGFIARETRYKVHKGQDSNGYDLRGLLRKLKDIAPEFEKVTDLNKRRRAKAEAK